jgi:hypothetical protein
MSIKRFFILVLIACLGMPYSNAGGLWSSEIELDGKKFMLPPTGSFPVDTNFFDSIAKRRIKLAMKNPIVPYALLKIAQSYGDESTKYYREQLVPRIYYKLPFIYLSKSMNGTRSYGSWEGILNAAEDHLKKLESTDLLVPIDAYRLLIADIKEVRAGDYKKLVLAFYDLALKIHKFFKKNAKTFKKPSEDGALITFCSDRDLLGNRYWPEYASYRKNFVHGFQVSINILDGLLYVINAKVYEGAGAFYTPLDTFMREIYIKLMHIVYPSINHASSEPTEAEAGLEYGASAGAGAAIPKLGTTPSGVSSLLPEAPAAAAGAGSARSSTTASSLSDHVGAE